MNSSLIPVRAAILASACLALTACAAPRVAPELRGDVAAREVMATYSDVWNSARQALRGLDLSVTSVNREDGIYYAGPRGAEQFEAACLVIFIADAGDGKVRVEVSSGSPDPRCNIGHGSRHHAILQAIVLAAATP